MKPQLTPALPYLVPSILSLPPATTCYTHCVLPPPHQALHSHLMSVYNSSLDNRSKGPRKAPQKFLTSL